MNFARIFEDVSTPLAVFDPEGQQLLSANDAWLELTGRPREELVGKPLLEVLGANASDQEAKDALKEVRDSFQRVATRLQPEELSLRCYPASRLRGSGQAHEQAWKVFNSPIKDERGKLLYLLHRVEDVTELHQARRQRGEAYEHRRFLANRADQMEAEIARSHAETERLNRHLKNAQRITQMGSWQLDTKTGLRDWSDEVCRLLGIKAGSKPKGADLILTVIHPDDRDDYVRRRATILAGHDLPAEFVHRIVRDDDSKTRHVRQRIEGEFDKRGKLVGLHGTIQDVTAIFETEDHLRQRARQQSAVAELGRMALMETDLGKVYDAAVGTVAETLGVEMCKILQLLPDQALVKLVAGVGWQEGLVGKATVGIGRDSQAGYTLQSDEPVVVDDLRTDKRFNGPALLRSHGVVSGLSVIIHGADGAWGVLGAHTTCRRSFDQDDVNFVRSVANIVAEANRRAAIEHTLHHSEHRTREIIDNALDAVVAIDYRGCINEWNRQAETIFGWSRSEAIGVPLHELIIPEAFRSAHLAGMEKYLATGEGPILNRRVEVKGLRKDGDEFPVELSVIPLVGDGGTRTFSAFLRDISERKEKEERLAQQAALLDKARDAIIVRDMDHRIRYWNQGAERIYGWRAEEAIGRCINELLHKDQAFFEKGVASLLETGGWTAKVTQRSKNRGDVVADISWTLVKNEAGDPEAVMSINTDVTVQEELEAKLKQSQRLEAVGQLTGGVAHDFNNILTVILGNAEILVGELSGEKRLRRLAEMTRDAATRGADLTHGLLAFSRRQALEPKPVGVNALIERLSSLLKRAVQESIELQFIPKEGISRAFIDPVQLESVLLNLVLNARDAMDGKGRLTIETNEAELDEAYAANNSEVEPGRYVMVAVSDTGRGIPRDIIDRVFDPFFTTKAEGKGSGLGLSMAYGFMKQSRGHIKIYSEPGQGTSVKLYLPVTTEEAVASTTRSASRRGEGELILVVEDDELVRMNVETQLEVLGYRVLTAASGPEALQKLEQHPDIDLLFTDVIMSGGMNGPELVERARSQRPGLKVLFTSGYTENAIVHQGRLDEGVILLQKPYRQNELATKIRNALASG